MNIQWLPPDLGSQSLLLALAFSLSLIVGVERQWHRKHAGVRTHVLVGVGSALFTLVSAHGFPHAITELTLMDPSRIAAQIVSGIGFLGAGVIFVRQDIVSGLTTAASIWMTAAIGMACGAGMPIIAMLGMSIHLVTTILIPLLRNRLRTRRLDDVRVTYKSGMDVLRSVLAAAAELELQTTLKHARIYDETRKRPRYEAVFTFTKDRARTERLIATVSSLPGVLSVHVVGDDEDD